MSSVIPRHSEQDVLPPLRAIADQAFSRAAGAPLVHGNRLRILKDAGENYPVWLEAICAARKRIFLKATSFVRMKWGTNSLGFSRPRRGKALLSGCSMTGWGLAAERVEASGEIFRSLGWK